MPTTKSRAAYMREWRRNRKGEPPHGTLDGYVNWRCRCPACVESHEQDREKRAARRYFARLGLDLDEVVRSVSSTSDVVGVSDGATTSSTSDTLDHS